MKIDDDILYLDLECVAYKACRDENWSIAKVDETEREYRAFLQLVRSFPNKSDIAPTRDVDRLWHHHILDTEKYAADCQRLFGVFLHHYPYSGIFSEQDAETQRDRVDRSRMLIHQILNQGEST
ncbi:MAG: glycine-rich domain-containing protein-like [Rudaea sp.]|uniref:glycine-rich domain-containing protein n=1 Tax=unclassified Rudaea TaxID=2627037 RepID=UPI0010F80820|nr:MULTISPECIES: glycine-rich domain-containing protein-like [unclassified Rudaea]MBN8885171.1 glycine-rich domain-containing protein-like [Rudaea sp.]